MGSLIRLVVVVVSLAATVPAEAHHMVGGTLPSSFAEGVLSGFAHPLIGLDHLLALVAVGLLARGARTPRAFMFGSLASLDEPFPPT